MNTGKTPEWTKYRRNFVSTLTYNFHQHVIDKKRMVTDIFWYPIKFSNYKTENYLVTSEIVLELVNISLYGRVDTHFTKNITDMYLLIFINTSEVKSHRKYVSPIYGTISPPSIPLPLLQGGERLHQPIVWIHRGA